MAETSMGIVHHPPYNLEKKHLEILFTHTEGTLPITVTTREVVMLHVSNFAEALKGLDQ